MAEREPSSTTETVTGNIVIANMGLKALDKKCQLITSLHFNEKCMEDYSEIVRRKLAEYLDQAVKVRLKTSDTMMMIVDRTLWQRSIHRLPLSYIVDTKIDEVSSRICYIIFRSCVDKHHVIALFCKSAGDTQKIVSHCQFRIRSMATYMNHNEWLNSSSYSSQLDSTSINSSLMDSPSIPLSRSSSSCRPMNTMSTQSGLAERNREAGECYPAINHQCCTNQPIMDLSYESREVELERVSGDGEDTKCDLIRNTPQLHQTDLRAQCSNSWVHRQQDITIREPNIERHDRPFPHETSQFPNYKASVASKGSLLMAVSPIEHDQSDSKSPSTPKPSSQAFIQGVGRAESSSDLSELDAVISGLQRLTAQSRVPCASQNLAPISPLPQSNNVTCTGLKNATSAGAYNSESLYWWTPTSSPNFTPQNGSQDEGAVILLQYSSPSGYYSNGAKLSPSPNIITTTHYDGGLSNECEVPIMHLSVPSVAGNGNHENNLDSMRFRDEGLGSDISPGQPMSFTQALKIYDQLSQQDQTTPRYLPNMSSVLSTQKSPIPRNNTGVTSSMVPPSPISTTRSPRNNNNNASRNVNESHCDSYLSPTEGSMWDHLESAGQDKKLERFFESIVEYGPACEQELYNQPDLVIDSLRQPMFSSPNRSNQ